MDEFEEFLKKEAAHFKLKPTEAVWTGVVEGIANPRRKLLWWYGAAVIFVLLSAGVYYFTASNSSQKQLALKEETNTAATHSLTESKPSAQAQKANKQENAFVPKTEQNASVSSKIDSKRNKPTAIVAELGETQTSKNKLPEEPIKAVQNTKKQHLQLDYLVQRNHTFKISSFSKVAPLEAKEVSIQKLSSRMPYKKFYYAASMGLTLAEPRNIKYDNFVKPSVGFNLQITSCYEFKKILGISIGIAYQQSSYKIGAVTIDPEPTYLNTSNGVLTRTARHKLSNESSNRNTRRQILLPLSLDSRFQIGTSGDQLKFSIGMDLAKELFPTYLIKNTDSDRLFKDNQLLNSFNNYLTCGVSYLHRNKNNLGFQFGYKLQYQNRNTYKNDYSLNEHILVNGVHLGIIF